MTPTCACGRPVGDSAYACPRCTDRLARDLGDLTALAEELDITRYRQSKTGGANIGIVVRDAERPLAWNDKAADVANDLRATVVSWCRIVGEERGVTLPADTLSAMGAFLLRHLEWLRHHQAACEVVDEIGHAVGRARSVIDRRPDRLYAGPCDPDGTHGDPCTQDLYARPGATSVTCRGCGLVWDVAERRGHMLEAARGMLVTATELAGFLSAYGERLKPERVRQWAARGQLAAHGTDAEGRPLYLVGDGADLLERMGKREGAA